MIDWWLILIALAALFIIIKFIHFRTFKHKFFAIVLVLLVLIIISTFVSVTQNSSIDLKSPSGLFQAGKIYFSWLGQTMGNLKVITANAIRMDWSPRNISLSK